MRAELKLLFARVQGTVVYVTHDQAEAMTLSDRIAVMNNGILQQLGTPVDVYNRPRNVFVARFLGNPSMNLLPCEICREAGSTYLAGSEFRYPLQGMLQAFAEHAPSQHVILGIRPEDVTIRAAPAVPGIPCRIELVEAMGAQHFIYASTGIGRIIITTGPDMPWAVGDQIWVTFDERKMHLFDRATERNIAYLVPEVVIA